MTDDTPHEDLHVGAAPSKWPAVYDYVRAEEPDEAAIAALRQELGRFCQAQGLHLVAVCCDWGGDGSEIARPGFAAVLGALSSPESIALVVPDLGHLSSDDVVREALLRSVRRTGAKVLVTRLRYWRKSSAWTQQTSPPSRISPSGEDWRLSGGPAWTRTHRARGDRRRGRLGLTKPLAAQEPSAPCEVLKRFLMSEVESPRGAGGIGSVECRAVVTLYSLLRDHSVDQWGRCRCCRRPGSVFGSRWRPCQVHSKADLCLRRLDEVLLLGLLAEQ